MKKFIRANNVSVYSKLGGGDHGHLGIVDNETAQFELTGHHCTHPSHPGLLSITSRITHNEASQLRDEHSKTTCLFCETTGVETLRNPIAIDRTFLSGIRNSDTSAFTDQLSKILDFLFIHYGQVDLECLKKREKGLCFYLELR